MPYGMYISAEGAAAQSQRLDVIANNLANVDTAGFKQDVPSFQARFAEAIQRGLDRPQSRSTNDLGGGVKVIDVETDFSPGQLQRTGNDLDLAIQGDGFFHVQGDDGEVYLSRAGNFAINNQGQLVTQNGHRLVLDQTGREITLADDQPWSISPAGFLSQGGTVYALGLSRPQSMKELVKVGKNLFRPIGPVEAVPPPERDVRQGYLEMSGANPIRQMMAMIETTRAFEANTRMIQNQDSAIGSLLNRVLRS